MGGVETIFGDLAVEIGDDFVATAEIRRPPHNFFDLDLVESLAAAFGTLDDDPGSQPEKNIYWASRAPWYANPADLPTFDEGR